MEKRVIFEEKAYRHLKNAGQRMKVRHAESDYRLDNLPNYITDLQALIRG